jgi:hypothetical protein
MESAKAEAMILTTSTNSDLYEACGYVRKSERRSGLTRKTAPAPATAAGK